MWHLQCNFLYLRACVIVYVPKMTEAALFHAFQATLCCISKYQGSLDHPCTKTTKSLFETRLQVKVGPCLYHLQCRHVCVDKYNFLSAVLGKCVE